MDLNVRGISFPDMTVSSKTEGRLVFQIKLMYRVIHKSLRDYRPMRYSSRDGHVEGEHVNRGRDSLSFCPTLQVLDMSTLGDILSTWQTFLAIARQSRPMATADLSVSQRTCSKSSRKLRIPLRNYFFCRWFCVVHGSKPPLHRHNWLSYDKFQDKERFLIPCPRHVSLRLPPSCENCKYATAPSRQKTWRDSLSIDMLLSAVAVLVVAQPSSDVPDGLMNYPVHTEQSGLSRWQ
jgi:hypothetical protein